MARLGRSRHRMKSRDAWKLVGGGFLIFFFLACAIGGTYVWITLPKPAVLSADTNCPANGPSAIAIVLVDASDDLPRAATQEIDKHLVDLLEQTPQHALLEVRVLDPKFTNGRVLFSRCNPGSGKDFDPIYGNPELAGKRWKERFADPFRKIIPQALAPTPANASPIMATIQGVALDHFTGRRVAPLSKSLIIFSDMLEHVPGYSQYKGQLNFQDFRSSLHYRNTRTNLNGAKIFIYYIDRPTARESGSVSHIKFWSEWFDDNRGTFIEAKRLQGVR